MRTRKLAAFAAMALVASVSIGTSSAAGPPSPAKTTVELTKASGFVPTSEVSIPGGVVDTFTSGTTVIKVVGRSGSTLSIDLPDQASSTAQGRIGLAMTTSRPKTKADYTSYHDSGRTVVGDLVALGMPRAEAIAQFGDMETMEGGAATANLGGRLASVAESGTAPAAGSAEGASTTVPYDTQCANVSFNSGKLVGYGCSTLYLIRVTASGDDWFNVKQKFSGKSTDTSWWSPQRLTQVAWDTAWSVNNVLYDWDPAGTQSVGSCGTVSVGVTSPYGGLTFSGQICPQSLGLWNLTSRQSGAIWKGKERNVDTYQAAIGAQSNHNPPTAAISYTSHVLMQYCDIGC